MWHSTQEGRFVAVNRSARGSPVLRAPMRLLAEYGVGLFAAVLPVTWVGCLAVLRLLIWAVTGLPCTPQRPLLTTAASGLLQC